jgi:hypothetical protein
MFHSLKGASYAVSSDQVKGESNIIGLDKKRAMA